MEELLSFKKDARLTVIKCPFYKNGLSKPPVLMYQVILSWNHGKYKTPDGILYNDFIEAFGETLNDCVNQLKEDVKKMLSEDIIRRVEKIAQESSY